MRFATSDKVALANALGTGAIVQRETGRWSGNFWGIGEHFWRATRFDPAVAHRRFTCVREKSIVPFALPQCCERLKYSLAGVTLTDSVTTLTQTQQQQEIDNTSVWASYASPWTSTGYVSGYLWDSCNSWWLQFDLLTAGGVNSNYSPNAWETFTQTGLVINGDGYLSGSTTLLKQGDWGSVPGPATLTIYFNPPPA
jgi:hypothetical protein